MLLEQFQELLVQLLEGQFSFRVIALEEMFGILRELCA